jgi:hypothetical protein
MRSEQEGRDVPEELAVTLGEIQRPVHRRA